MAEPRITFHPERRAGATLRLTETHWGYIVSEADGALGGPALTEAGLRFLGLVLVLASYIQWLLPDGLYRVDPLGAKIGMSALFALAGAALYFVANVGFERAIEVDTQERVVRFVRRNGRGRARVLQSVPFDAIGSVFVRRHEGAMAELRLGIAGLDESLHVMRGADRDLHLLHARLCRDLKSPAERLEARLRLIPSRRVAVRAPLRRSA